PIEPALEQEVDDIIVLLTRPPNYRKNPRLVSPALLKLHFPGYPDLISAISQRALRYNAQLDKLARLEAQRRITVIRPTEPLPASRITRDKQRIMSSIELGRSAVETWVQGPGGLLLR